MNEDTRPAEPFRLLDRTAAFRGRAIDVYIDRLERSDGTVLRREIVVHPGAVAIVAATRSDEILLVRQERPATSGLLWEIPAGTLEPDETPLACAKRELIEETGYEAGEWEELLGFYTTPGFSNERITLFAARRLRPVGRPDPDEIALCRSFTLRDLEEMIRSGTLEDAKSILALLLYQREHRMDATPR